MLENGKIEREDSSLIILSGYTFEYGIHLETNHCYATGTINPDGSTSIASGIILKRPIIPFFVERFGIQPRSILTFLVRTIQGMGLLLACMLVDASRLFPHVQEWLRNSLPVIFVLAWIYNYFPFKKSLWQLHATEHMVIDCIERSLPLTEENVRNCSFITISCGTTIPAMQILLWLIIGWPLYHLIGSMILVFAFINLLSNKLVQRAQEKRILWLLKVLTFYQYWRCRKPTDSQINFGVRVARELQTADEKYSPPDEVEGALAELSIVLSLLSHL